ncbi:MAG: hypothetical protein Q8S43_09855 [Actinomycetota bacterium]|nr:MAG: hypothetical protein FD171_93 [Actinomycetota bacterium]MDO8950655.1 hypothetical protein [Actinomycetota bacterium]MDP3631235.1 hypothetical protein [Actinomycetota bacterium]
MHGNTLAGPGIIFFQVLTFALVLGGLAMIVHALTRPADRWRHPWTRFIWVALAAAWSLSLVFALIWRNDTTFTVVGIAFVVILVTEVTYLLRVVFPARGASAATNPDTTIEEQSTDA